MLDQPAPQLPAAGQPFNVMQAIIGIITQPVPTLREIATVRPWLMALLVYIVISVLSGVAGSLGFNLDAQLAQVPPENREQLEPLLRGIFSPATLIGGSLITAPILLALVSGIFWIVGRLLGGTGTYSAVFSTQGFASAPTLVSAAVSFVVGLIGLAAPVAGLALSPLSGLIGFGVAIWGIVLSVIGIRESMGFSTGRAVATVLIPGAVLIGLCCVIGFAFFAVIAAAIGSAVQR
jgi:hypothetical protein